MPESLKSIPNYLLYGDPSGEAELDFVHVESIPSRSSLHNWEIKPHRHRDLSHLLLITAGGGLMTADGAEHSFRAPALLAMPAETVHGFRFDPDIDGHILTMSAGFLANLLAGLPEPELKAVLDRPAALPADPAGEDWPTLTAAFAAILREFHWPRPGRASAIAAQVTLLLVTAARLGLAGGKDAGPLSADALLVARLRQTIGQRFRDHWPVEAYAAALGTSPGRLNAACRRVAGASTLQLVHARLLLEAKRNLLYTAMTMSEIGYAMGFEDPAYFSRFFTKREGLSPQAFRQRHGRGR